MKKSKWLWNYQKIVRKQAEAIRIYGLDKWKAKGNGLFLYKVGSSYLSG